MTLFSSMLADPQSAWQWAVAIFNIVSIDIVLAGDNAIVIAMAVRNLPSRQRRMGIIFGAGASVMLRAILTVGTTQLLEIDYLKLIGGVLILWIAFKLLRDNEAQQESEKEGAKSLWHAVWMIIVADITMSLDNVLAVGGAASGHISLIIFGLVLSIPLVVFGSNLVSNLMSRYPIIIFLGAAILGKVATEMMLTDPVVEEYGISQWERVTGTHDAVGAYHWLCFIAEYAIATSLFFFGWFRSRKPAVA